MSFLLMDTSYVVAPASLRLRLPPVCTTFASTSDSRRIRTSSVPSLISVPPYLEKITSSPSATSIWMYSPVSWLRAPGPTARTVPRCGFSFAVSGSTIPLTVNSSSSRTSTIKRSPSGFRFMEIPPCKNSLRSLTNDVFYGTLCERGNPVRYRRAAGLAGDQRASRDLRRVRECVFELLLTHPPCGDTGRLVGLRRSLEEPDRGQNTRAGVDQVITAEAGQLPQTWHQALGDLPRHFFGAHLVDALVAAHGRIHVIASISLDLRRRTPKTGPPDALRPFV